MSTQTKQHRHLVAREGGRVTTCSEPTQAERVRLHVRLQIATGPGR